LSDPLRISWSALRSHFECKQRGHLLRLGKRSTTSDIRVFFHGTVSDRVMRDWLATDDYPPGGMRRAVREIVDREEKSARESGDGVVRWKSRTDREDLIKFCEELADRLEPILYEHVVPYDYEVAKRFKVPIVVPYLDGTPTTIHLSGETDLIVGALGSSYKILDLKATRDDNYYRKTMGQMVFYDLAGKELFGTHPTEVGLVQPMCKQGVISWVVTQEQRMALMAQILEMTRDIWTQNFPLASDSGACRYCQVKHGCPKYKKPTFSTVLSMDDLRSMVQRGADDE
jgi:hypothetical protein